MERMLMMQALDERDLLMKKIGDKIAKASFAGVKKHNAEKILDKHIEAETFSKEAQSTFQQIKDLIDRFNRLDTAIISSNAAVKVRTSFGEYSVANAISLRNRLRGQGSYAESGSFESILLNKLEAELDGSRITAGKKNAELQAAAENMRLAILGKDMKNSKDQQPLGVVEAYVAENTYELVDPLDAAKQIEKLKEQLDRLITELDTQIKVANATNFVEF